MEDKRHASSQVTTSGIYLKPHYLGATFALWYCFFVQGGLLTRLPLVGKGPRFSLSFCTWKHVGPETGLLVAADREKELH